MHHAGDPSDVAVSRGDWLPRGTSDADLIPTRDGDGLAPDRARGR